MLPLLHLLTLIASVAATTSILLPLYVYPGDDSLDSPNAANWVNATAAIKAYPKVNWWVIVNPDSGPGSSQYPDSNHIYGISQLKNFSNVLTLGYVDTDFTRRTIQNVTGNVEIYAGWSHYSKANISMDGIFFDDVPNAYDLQTEFPKLKDSNDTYYENVTTFARDTLAGNNTLTVLNSGSPGPTEFYDYCDVVVEEEIPFYDWSGQDTLDDLTTNSSAILNRTSIILYDVPTNLTTDGLNSLIHTIKKNNVSFITLTQDCCYNAINGSFLKAVAAAVDSA